MLVEGAIVDADGIRPAYVRVREGRVVEVGALGTAGRRRSERRLRGVVVPPPVDGHTHLGDSVSEREPPHVPVERIVAPPHGLKFRLLSETPPRRKQAAMRRALRRLVREGVAATLDFREEGPSGVELLHSAARGLPIRPVIFGRPAGPDPTVAEIDALLERADGIGVSAVSDLPGELRRRLAQRCRAARKYYALHASEVRREDPEAYLHPTPDLVVHLLRATTGDLEQVVEAGVTVAVCPRSNALFHRRPPLQALERLGARVLLGTDNAMFQAPSVLRELEFAYLSARHARAPVSPEFLVRSAFVEPWRFLKEPERAHIRPGAPAPLLFRLPTGDPAYQLVTRATEHLISRPESRSARAAGAR